MGLGKRMEDGRWEIRVRDLRQQQKKGDRRLKLMAVLRIGGCVKAFQRMRDKMMVWEWE